jgi:hypothetical protein
MLPILDVCQNTLGYSGASTVATGFLVIFVLLLTADAVLTWRGLNLALETQKDHGLVIQQEAFPKL